MEKTRPNNIMNHLGYMLKKNYQRPGTYSGRQKRIQLNIKPLLLEENKYLTI